MIGAHASERRRRMGRAIVVGLLLVLLRPATPGAQEVTAPALKAAFLFKFVMFTTWPADVLPDDSPLLMCVVNAPAIGSALADTVKDRVVAGRAIRVAQPADANAMRGCHVLYVGGPRSVALSAIAAVRHMPVLTVSDVQAFTKEGGIAQLYVQQGQLRFAFALDAIRAARLQISSKLLALSREP